ncbi:MAG TPA: EAL domain-containing protein [Thermoanaerobaculia bacterium]|nr:EAL domain-containing protein [Thermoanaerobaculia bacterium]
MSGGPRPAAPGPLAGDWFRTVAETTAAALFVYDQTRFLYVNPAACELTGFPEQELLLLLRPRDLLLPEQVDALARYRPDRPLASPATRRDEFVMRRKDGDGRWVLLTTTVIQWHGRTAALGTAHDVTERIWAEEALRHSQDRLQLAQKAGRSIVWEWDVASDRMQLSSFAMELFGASSSEVPRSGEELMRFVPPEDQELIHRTLRRTLHEGKPYVLEHRILTPSGQMRWLAVRGQVLESERGVQILGVSADISEHKAAEEALLREQERAQVTLASIGDGVIRTDSLGQVDYLNPIAEQLTGVPLAEALGRPLAEIYRVVDEESRHPRPDPVTRCLAEGQVVVLAEPGVLLRGDGVEFAVRDSAAPIRDQNGSSCGAVVVFQDVSQLRRLEREMAWLAGHDPLTGLLNRRQLEGELDAALAAVRSDGRHHVFCYLDLDEFKVVNDTCGHVAGDELLRQLAALLSSQVREGDVLSRLGGDEFGVLLSDCSLENARRIADKLCRTVRQHRFEWEGRACDVGVSIGVVGVDAASGSLAQVLSAADAACYVAKEQGRNRTHVYQPDDRAVAERYGEMQWVQRIHHAFEHDGFRLLRQPIRPLAAGGTEMAEVLLRMVGDDGTAYPTASFIAAAERYHLIGSLDRWVVYRALPRLAALDEATVFTINLSGQSLGDPAFLELVMERLRSSHLPPERLCFEITETATITNLARARHFLAVVRAAGCRFVLDDFGTGLSSFAYLQSLPVDFLKIDGEFVRHLTGDPVQRALVESIHEIGHLMGLITIAEAVEDEETLEALRAMGLDYAQGYLLGRPEEL